MIQEPWMLFLLVVNGSEHYPTYFITIWSRDGMSSFKEASYPIRPLKYLNNLLHSNSLALFASFENLKSFLFNKASFKIFEKQPFSLTKNCFPSNDWNFWTSFYTFIKTFHLFWSRFYFEFILWRYKTNFVSRGS